MNPTGDTNLVTGGGSGVGRGLAKALANACCAAEDARVDAVFRGMNPAPGDIRLTRSP